jgi:D-alanyl-D-alanine dipeptidase
MATRFVLLLIALISAYINTVARPATDTSGLYKLHATQLIVVVANGWDSSKATLYTFEKIEGKWVKQFSNPVFIGAKGMGDGIVPMFIKGAPVKKEGDLKAPGGIFKIGAAFGYAGNSEAHWVKNKYIEAKDTVICVDDVHSIYYNRIISADTAVNDWNSFEHMHRNDDYYKWGLFVEHNAPATMPGHGSCIFMHIGTGDNFATEGCTAMAESDMLRLLHWINSMDNPLLVQLPANEYNAARQKFGLPGLNN